MGSSFTYFKIIWSRKLIVLSFFYFLIFYSKDTVTISTYTLIQACIRPQSKRYDNEYNCQVCNSFIFCICAFLLMLRYFLSFEVPIFKKRTPCTFLVSNADNKTLKGCVVYANIVYNA